MDIGYKVGVRKREGERERERREKEKERRKQDERRKRSGPEMGARNNKGGGMNWVDRRGREQVRVRRERRE